MTNVWGDYSVEARVRFATGAFGGGIGGRVNAANGAHYAAWVYPEGSPGGSQLLKLIKFQDWTDFGYNGTGGAVMAQVNLSSVGTNYHTVKLAFRGNRIAVYFDGAQMMSVSDVEAQPYTGGGVSLDLWTASSGYLFNADDVAVKPLVTSDSYATLEDTPLTVWAAGVLTNDTGVYSTNLVAALMTGPSHGLLSLGANGGFTYAPFTNYNGPDSFIYQASDGGTNLGTATVSLVVTPVNDPPVLPAQADETVAELTELVVTNAASDPDGPGDALSYALVNAPAGASVGSDGVITWTPSEAQGPSTNVITTVVTDGGSPPLSATNSFIVVVTEVNSAPVLPAQTNLVVPELVAVVVTNTATDADIPANNLFYALSDPPAGAAIDTNGVITWTPSEAQGPGSYEVTTVVTDDGLPPLSATNSFAVVVTEVNSAPALPAQADRTIGARETLVVTNTAVDADLPLNLLSYVLVDPPAAAVIDTNGVITWTPGEAQAPSTNLFATVVTDDGSPPLSATNTFTVIVRTPPEPPQIVSISLSNDVALIAWTAVAGAHYTVQYKNELNDEGWISVEPDVVASSSTASASVPGNGVLQRSFRVVLLE